MRTSIPIQNFWITAPGRLKVDITLGEMIIKAGNLEIQFTGEEDGGDGNL